MNSVFEVFQATAGRCPDAPFLCVPARPTRDYFPEGAEFSYRWMLEQALQTAQCYAQAGYGSGHRVALLLENRPVFFVHYLALNSLGASIVPINPDYRHDEIDLNQTAFGNFETIGATFKNRQTEGKLEVESQPVATPLGALTSIIGLQGAYQRLDTLGMAARELE